MPRRPIHQDLSPDGRMMTEAELRPLPADALQVDVILTGGLRLRLFAHEQYRWFRLWANTR